MRRQQIQVGRIFGIPVGLDYSWFLIFAVMTWMLASDHYPHVLPDWSAAWHWLLGATTTVMLFVSVLLHELGHSLVARGFRLKVRRITLFLFGGVAEIGSEPRSAWAEFWIAVAGPAVSFALGGFFHMLSAFAGGQPLLLALMHYLALINLALALFNLVPGFPLDGGRVFRAVVWGITGNFEKATRIAALVGRVFAFIFIYLGVTQIFAGNIGDGLWIIFIGWFLDNAAQVQIQRQHFRNLIAGHRVSEAMNANFAVVPLEMSLKEIAGYHVLGPGRRCVVVLHGEQVAGMLTLHKLQEIPEEKWAETNAGQAMIPVSRFKKVQPTTEVWQAMELMDRDGVNQLPVMVDHRVVGLLSRDDLISFFKSIHETAR